MLKLWLYFNVCYFEFFCCVCPRAHTTILHVFIFCNHCSMYVLMAIVYVCLVFEIISLLALKRMVPALYVWLVSILLPLIGLVLIDLYLLNKHLKYKTKEWLLDDDISFIKGMCILFFLCYGGVAFISARISLPKASAYDICDYSLEEQECTKVKFVSKKL